NINRTMSQVRAEIDELEKRVAMVQDMARTRRDAILKKREAEERAALERPTSASTVVAPAPMSPPRPPAHSTPTGERPPIPMPFNPAIEEDAESIMSSAITPTCCALGPDDSASNAPSRRRKKHHSHGHHHSSRPYSPTHSSIHRSRDPTRRSSSRARSRDPRSASRTGSRRKRIIDDEPIRSVEEVMREGEKGKLWPKVMTKFFTSSDGKEKEGKGGLESSQIGSVKKKERSSGTVVSKEGSGRKKEDGTRETKEEREARKEKE